MAFSFQKWYERAYDHHNGDIEVIAFEAYRKGQQVAEEDAKKALILAGQQNHFRNQEIVGIHARLTKALADNQALKDRLGK